MAKTEPQFKIGFVLDGGLEKPDGVQQYILALGMHFESAGHSVRYLVAGSLPSGIPNAVSLAKSLKVDSNGNRLSIPLPASSRRIRAYLKKEKFDVLHIQTPYSPMMGEKVVFAAGKRCAVIGTYHIVPSKWYLSIGNWLLGKWCYFSLKRFDQMISVSPAAKRIAKRDFAVDSVVIPNIVDWHKYASAKPAAKDAQLKILFVGRLVPRKGCYELLRAVNYLIKSSANLPKFKLVIAGSGPLEKTLKKYVADNSLNGIVDFIGYVNEADKPSLYASADICVFPSLSGESFGIVLIEALASGRAAVLAGNNEGYSSVLEDRKELLFNPSDTKEFASLLSTYLESSEKRQAAASWGQAYSKRFDINNVAKEIMASYLASIAKKRNQIDN